MLLSSSVLLEANCKFFKNKNIIMKQFPWYLMIDILEMFPRERVYAY